MKFVLETRDPLQLRYPTVGDWSGSLEDGVAIQVVEGDDDHAFLLMVHELIESYLCLKEGIPVEAVDDWDMMHLHSDEAGDEPGAPYGKQHAIAAGVERILAAVLGVNWMAYDKRLDRIHKNMVADRREVMTKVAE